MDTFWYRISLVDNKIGLWIKDGVYQLVLSSKEKLENRIYLNVLSECSEVPYFKSGKPRSGQMLLFKEGRVYPIQAMKDNVVLKSITQIVDAKPANIKMFKEIENKVYDIGTLICSGWDYTGIAFCSETGYKMTASLINALSSLVFDAHQSVVELVVNSIDAYNVEEAVGKFGVGFYSIISWILKDHSRRIVIHSYVEEEYGNYSYEAVLYIDNEGRLKFEISFNKSRTNLTGTRVSIVKDTKPVFTINDQLEFIKQIRKLKYANVNILLNEEWLNPETEYKDRLVVCKISSEEFYVEDYATGIPLNILTTKLLIPSVSTKTIKSSFAKTKRSRKNIVKASTDGIFGIIVNGVLVVSIPTNYPKEIILSLPSDVLINISRDDVTFEDKHRSFFEELFDECVQNNCVFELQCSLEKYFHNTTQTNKSLLERWLAICEEKHSQVLVMGDLGRLPGLIRSMRQDTERCMKAVRETLTWYRNLGELYYGKTVFVIDEPNFPYDPEIYIPDIVLVSSQLTTELGEDWVNLLPLRYFKVGKLYPRSLFTMPTAPKDRGEIYFYYVRSLVESLNKIALFRDGNFNFVEVLFHSRAMMGDARFIRFCKALIIELSNYKPSDSCGMLIEQFSLSMLFRPFLSMCGTLCSIEEVNKVMDFEIDLLVNCMKNRVIQPVTFWMPSNGCFTGVIEGEMSYFIQLVNKSQNYIELYWLYKVLKFATIDPTQAVDLTLQKIRDRHPTASDIVNHYLGVSSMEDVILVSQITDFFVIPEALTNEVQIPQIFEGPSFTATDLMNYCFHHDLTPDTMNEVSRGTDRGIQAVNIAINYISPGIWIDNVIDECIKNSIEAFYLSGLPQGAIQINVEAISGGIKISFIDNIGMNFDSFLAVAIPFLSTKYQTGSGIFRLYQKAKRVRIFTTQKDSTEGWLWDDFPTNYFEGKPTEIIKQFSKIAPIIGTTIEVYAEASLADLVSMYSRIQFRLMQIYSLAQVPGFQILFGNIPVVSERIFIENYSKNGEIVLSVEHINGDVPSYILIAGVPFAPISRYYQHHQNIARNVCFNVKNESIIKSKIFKEAVGKVLAYEAFRLAFEGKGVDFDPNTSSTFDPYSVLPRKSVSSPLEVYKNPNLWPSCAFFPGISIQTLIWQASEMLGTSLWEQFDQNLIYNEIPTTNIEYNNVLKFALNKWMTPKNTTPSPIFQDIHEDENLSRIADILVQTYWSIGKDLGITGFNGDIRGIGLTGKGRSFFDGQTVVMFGLQEAKVQEFIETGVWENALNFSYEVEGVLGEAGVLSHEIEHARRQQQSSQSDPPHSDYTGKLWVDDIKQKRSFLQCQIVVYRKIISEGNFWKTFFQIYQDSLN